MSHRYSRVSRVCGFLIAMFLIATAVRAMIMLGPVPNCDVLVLDGSYYMASDSNGPLTMLYVKILKVGGQDSSLTPGTKLWLYVRGVEQSSAPIFIGHKLHGVLDGSCDDIGTGRSSWGFVDNHYTIKGAEGPLKPLGLTPPSYQNILRFFCLLVWVAITGWIFKRYRRRAVSKEVCTFTRQLSLMSGSGTPLQECLAVLIEQSRSKFFRSVLVKIYSDIDSGISLSTAVEKHRSLFSDIFVCLIKDGETSGRLAQNLGILADFLEGAERRHNRATSSTIYPGVVLIITGIVVMGLLIFPIRQFKEAFGYMEVSVVMKLLFGISDILVSWWYLVLTVSVIGAFLAVSVLDHSVGKVIRTSVMVTFSRNMSILAALGVPLLRAIEVSTQTTRGDIQTETLTPPGNQTEGATTAQPDALPANDAGQVTAKLVQIADFCDSGADKAFSRMNTIVEICTILIMALVVGGIVATVFRPFGSPLFGKWW